MHTIEQLTPERAEHVQDQLVALLKDAVHNGASVGFVSPLADEIARRYWHDVFKDLHQGSRLLLALTEGGQIVGSVQLALCMRPNGTHRAEVQKLFAHTKSRHKGFGRALMAAIEQERAGTTALCSTSILNLTSQPMRCMADLAGFPSEKSLISRQVQTVVCMAR